jgi:single-stranded-DNA-specific exonuclease
LLVQRGHTTADAARRFLKPSRQDLHDPALLPDLAVAVERLTRAIRGGETVLVHGDYDVDGQCATTIMTRVIRHAGGRAAAFVPHRVRDGYDLSSAGVRAAVEAGAKVILTLDCGTTAFNAVSEARAHGMDVIVVDHHLPQERRPDAIALVNPKRPESRYPFPDLCGAGLAWKLGLALLEHLKLGDVFAWHLVDLAAIATVADLVPLTGENRIIVRYGLRVLKQTRWPGLRALLATSGLANRGIRAGQVGFVLGPRINAVGRVGDANDGLKLLLTDEPAEAERLAAQLERQNAERQELDQRTLDEALETLMQNYDEQRDVGVVIAREGWHPGVIGIVASRVVERIARPVFMVAMEGGVGKGSGRSVSGCDLHAALKQSAGHLERWGGHRMAAGLTIRAEQLEAFRAAFNAACGAQISASECVPTQRVDAVLGLGDLTGEFERLLRALEPTGMGNPGPVFGLDGIGLSSARPIGDRHIRFELTDGAASLRTIAWGCRQQVEQLMTTQASGLRPQSYRVAVRLDRDTWLGRETVEGRLVTLGGR